MTPRLSGAFAVSGAVHALVLAALLAMHVMPAPITTPVHVFPVWHQRVYTYR